MLCSLESKSKSQLTQELAIEKRKNDILMKKLKEAKKLIKIYEQQSHIAGEFTWRTKLSTNQFLFNHILCFRNKVKLESRLLLRFSSNRQVLEVEDPKEEDFYNLWWWGNLEVYIQPCHPTFL